MTVEEILKKLNCKKAIFITKIDDCKIYRPDFNDVPTGLPFFIIERNKKAIEVSGNEGLELLEYLVDKKIL